MKRWKLIVGVTCVFALGVLVGTLGTQLYHGHWVDRFWKDSAGRRAVFLQKLTRELRLTGGQQKEFEVIVEEVDKKLVELHRKKRADFKKILDESFSRMKKSLDPDQQQKLEELRARREERMKDRKRRHHF
ncbi:MAG: hypothetical protein V1689_12615 [Pseudomonadota bacterium]